MKLRTAVLAVATIVSVVAFVAMATVTGLFSSLRGEVPSAVVSRGGLGAGQGVGAASDLADAHGGARQLLADWDDHRSAAWAQGDVVALQSLYVPGSRAGAADVRMLRSWRSRGMRVEGMRMQVLDFQMLRRDDDEVVVRVTDRLVGGVAVGGGTRVPLPTDRAEQRTITLQRLWGRWLVDSVV